MEDQNGKDEGRAQRSHKVAEGPWKTSALNSAFELMHLKDKVTGKEVTTKPYAAQQAGDRANPVLSSWTDKGEVEKDVVAKSMCSGIRHM